ncbi:sorbitol dehydrogenase [Pragia fontium]|uniref:Sorbitol dehydrogenase n=1 Tax=Pragia fontium TaxID=82985 RepID=A0ABQ5LNQ3_9GAMM|nr:cytochrome c [Pragia fontium]GKX64268.1 sorbitol dehydrogenase [Pragia fontium]
MKIDCKRLTVVTVLIGLFVSFPLLAVESEANNALIERGKYIAIAADCAACHRQAVENGVPFAGGYAIASPMGNIIASNITPSRQFGIGNYTEIQFADAVRRGVAQDGRNLYPAMPYTAYYGISDQDIHALYAYFMQGVKPADIAPTAVTDLGFPFNIRQVMLGWNLLYRKEKQLEKQAGISEQLYRGQYLVEVLGHCSTCHTPRNMMMAEKSSLYLSGSPLGGWYAPNITSDSSGIAGWSQRDLVTYLQTGHLANKAQAAGPMAEAVEKSFRFMTDEDLNAMAAWIKQVPAVSTPVATKSPRSLATDINNVIIGQGNQASLVDISQTDGATLYESACASCHGRQGQGTADNFYPSLTHNSAVSGPGPQNLVMTIVMGIQRKGSDGEVSMPAFGQQMNNEQIASLSNYVRNQFANIDDRLTAENVQMLRNGGELPFIVLYLNWLMGGGAVIVLLILFGLMRLRKR